MNRARINLHSAFVRPHDPGIYNNITRSGCSRSDLCVLMDHAPICLLKEINPMKHLKAIVLSCAMLLAVSAFAWQSPSGQDNKQNHSGMGQQSLDEHVKMVSEKLGLSEDQQAKAKAVLVEQQQQAAAIRNDSSLSQDEKREKMRSLRDATHAKIREMLNDDQKQKFDQMIQEMANHSKEGKSGDTPK